MNVHVLIVDDHPVVRSGITLLLEQEGDITTVGQARSAAEALDEAVRLRPDIVVMDLLLPNGSGIAATQAIKEAVPNANVVVLSMENDAHYVAAAFAAGAQGYVLKSSSGRVLVAAVRALAAGANYVDPELGACLGAGPPGVEPPSDIDPLTAREREVLRLIALGHTYREIARTLHISTGTVATHRARIAKKVRVSTRADLVQYAFTHGLTS